MIAVRWPDKKLVDPWRDPSQSRHDIAATSADNRDSGDKGTPRAADRGVLNVAERQRCSGRRGRGRGRRYCDAAPKWRPQLRLGPSSTFRLLQLGMPSASFRGMRTRRGFARECGRATCWGTTAWPGLSICAMSLVVMTAPPAVGAQSQNLSVGLCLTGLKSGTCTTAIEELSAFSLSAAPGSSGSPGAVVTATATMPVNTASVLLVNDVVVTKAGLPTFVVEFPVACFRPGSGLVFSGSIQPSRHLELLVAGRSRDRPIRADHLHRQFQSRLSLDGDEADPTASRLAVSGTDISLRVFDRRSSATGAIGLLECC